jgi:CRISPR-associated protein Csb2
VILVLEVEYLSGVSFAAIGPDNEVPDWPPQPDRIFSALVATWAARGEREDEAAALQWLERVPAPHLLASDAQVRTGAIVFVPPNDPRSDKQKHAKGVLPALRSRQPRRFPAARPHDRITRLIWSDVEPAPENLAALQRLARDTAYVGHSASLTRCRFLREDGVANLRHAKAPQRWVYAGRFVELCRAFNAGRRPFSGARVAPMSERGQERTNVFSRRWLILEHVAGDIPDVRASALVSKAIRDALLSGYRQIGLADAVPEIISGHDADGGVTRLPHMAIVPLAFLGFPYADGHLMGFAVVPPTDGSILDDRGFRRVLRTLAPVDEKRGRRILTVKSASGTTRSAAFSIDLSPTFEAPVGARSLDPTLYFGPARYFATLTPIVLDRHLKEEGEARRREIATLVASACGNIGLPHPQGVAADKHSAVEGAPSAYPSGKSPAWMHWRVPSSLASRPLTHAVVQFASPVAGPVILGAGRFLGLGLCRPLDRSG